MNIDAELEAYKTEWEMQEAKTPKPKIDRAAILRKLDKLKDLYVNDLITMEQYRADYERYSAQLAEIAPDIAPAPDFTGLRQKLTDDFPKVYKTLDRTQRRALWRSVLSAIYVDAENTLHIKFR